jgi:hypothetical protein
MHREARLAAAFFELSDIHNRDFDMTSYAHLLAGHSVQLLNVDAAGLLLSEEDGQLEATGATTDAARLLQLIQLRLDEGPGIDSVRTQRPVSVPDLRSDPRWGAFRTAVLNAGFAAVHAVPMQVRGDVIGSMSLFRRRAGGLSEDDLALGESLVHVATNCMLLNRAVGKGEKLSGQLQTALNTRVAIEQAKGILAERRGSTLDSAFELMRAFARHDRRQLTEVAHAVINGSPSVSSLTGSPANPPRSQ